jgi:flagellar biosynthesis protein FliQ
MSPDEIIALTRQTLEAAFWVAAPILVAATVVSLLINIGQVMTSIQDPTWMLHHLVAFTTRLFGDFHAFTR